MKYYNTQRQMSEMPLCKMAAHLYHTKDITEDKCFYIDRDGDLLPPPIPAVAPKRLALYVVAHGNRGSAGVSDLNEGPDIQRLSGPRLAGRIRSVLLALHVAPTADIEIRLPFCYGGLKQPSLQAFVDDFRNGDRFREHTIAVEYRTGAPRVTSVRARGPGMPAQSWIVSKVQAALDEALETIFDPEVSRAANAIGQAKWDAGEQANKIWNRSLAKELAINLRSTPFGDYQSVTCGGFEHPMFYVRGGALHPVTRFPSFPLEPALEGEPGHRVKKSYFDGEGARILQRKKLLPRHKYCLFPFYYATKAAYLQTPGMHAPAYQAAWANFY